MELPLRVRIPSLCLRITVAYVLCFPKIDCEQHIEQHLYFTFLVDTTLTPELLREIVLREEIAALADIGRPIGRFLPEARQAWRALEGCWVMVEEANLYCCTPDVES